MRLRATRTELLAETSMTAAANGTPTSHTAMLVLVATLLPHEYALLFKARSDVLSVPKRVAIKAKF